MNKNFAISYLSSDAGLSSLLWSSLCLSLDGPEVAVE